MLRDTPTACPRCGGPIYVAVRATDVRWDPGLGAVEVEFRPSRHSHFCSVDSTASVAEGDAVAGALLAHVNRALIDAGLQRPVDPAVTRALAERLEERKRGHR